MRILSRGVTINAADVGDLQEALDQLPECGGAVYLPAGTYEIDRTVRCALREGQHLLLCGDGRATVIRFAATDGSHLLELSGVKNSWWPDLKITLRDLTLVGNYECGDAFHLRWPKDTMVDACFFEAFGGTAIRVSPNATNVTIRDCWMRDCKRALHADNLHHLTFHGNQTRSSNDGQVQDEHVYIGRHCREVRIVNNHIAYGHNEGIILDGTAQHVVANNTIEGFTVGIRAIDCRDIAIQSNYLHCPTGLLMEADTRGMTVSGNLLTTNSEGAVVIRDARGSGGHVITGNIIRRSLYDEPQRGIDLGDSVGCVVTSNTLEDTSDGPPIVSDGDPAVHEIANNCVHDTTAEARERYRGGEVAPVPEDHPYRGLYNYLRAIPPERDRIATGFWAFAREDVLGRPLPDAAKEDRAWWANDPANEQAAAWLSAGWLVVIVKCIENRVAFARMG